MTHHINLFFELIKKRSQYKMKRKISIFTLVELLIVIAIIAILA